MFSGPGLKLGRVMGIPIFVNWSWVLIFFLFTVMLESQFSTEHPGWTPTQHWGLAALASLLLFGSVLFHELGHSTVALRYKIPVLSITLFVFGGVAAIAREPERPLQEFNIAIAGPATSLLLAGIFYGLALPFSPNSMFAATAMLLAYLNALLAVFNLVPGFPLDGGRILRSIIWAKNKNFNRATQLASRSGQVVAYILIALGIAVALLEGDWVSGVWWVFIGWFLLTAAKQSYAQVAVQRVLDGLRAADVMTSELPMIDRSISLEDYVQEVLRTGRRAHLVLGNNELVGMISLQDVHGIPRHEWPSTSIQATMVPIDRIQWVQADEPAMKILERMQSTNVYQMPVLRDGQVVGMVSRDAMLRVIQTRLQFERFAHA
jgi:Zn-dependent protease